MGQGIPQTEWANYPWGPGPWLAQKGSCSPLLSSHVNPCLAAVGLTAPISDGDVAGLRMFRNVSEEGEAVIPPSQLRITHKKADLGWLLRNGYPDSASDLSVE